MSQNLDNSQPKAPHVSLSEIHEQLCDCRRCPLGETRNKLVFGSGDPHARVMLIGEAPGAQEDKTGEPFVGAAGKHLSELLAHAGLERSSAYIANILKCRPPGNRDPQPEEIKVCVPFLREQIRSIWPDVIVCLGNFATRFVLKTDQGVSALHGQHFKAGHFVVVPSYHPAAAIYNPRLKSVIEDDFTALGAWLKEQRIIEP